MKRSELKAQFTDTGAAMVPLTAGRTVQHAAALLRGAAQELGAKVRTHAVEQKKNQGATAVIGEITHGAVSQTGCYICRQTSERLARTMWRFTFTDPLHSCTGTLSKILNDDPENWQEEVIARYLPDASRAAWLALKRDAA